MNLCKKENRPFVLKQLSELDPETLGYLLIIANELRSAREKHPKWPKDLIHQTAVVSEEAGELTRASLHYYYEDGKYYDMHKEAVQTGAMALRFLVENWNRRKEIQDRRLE